MDHWEVTIASRYVRSILNLSTGSFKDRRIFSPPRQVVTDGNQLEEESKHNFRLETVKEFLFHWQYLIPQNHGTRRISNYWRQKKNHGEWKVRNSYNHWIYFLGQKDNSWSCARAASAMIPGTSYLGKWTWFWWVRSNWLASCNCLNNEGGYPGSHRTLWSSELMRFKRFTPRLSFICPSASKAGVSTQFGRLAVHIRRSTVAWFAC